jgi:hypothetical protein
MTEQVSGETVADDQDLNAKYRVMEFKVAGSRKAVYLLNPGDHFQRFGGSSCGLVVRKTASLIVSEWQGGCRHDTEYDINKPDVWARILNAYRGSLGLPVTV